MMLKKIFLSSALFCAVAASSGTAIGATVNVTKQHSSVFGDDLGANKWFIKASYTNGTDSREKVGAGLFRLLAKDEMNVVTKFGAFCMSPFEWLRLPLDYAVGTDLPSGVVNKLSALANGAWTQIVDSKTAGAFQLAVWEIVSESAVGPLDVASGSFKVTYVSNTDAVGLANNWLASVTSGAFNANPTQITILSANDTQDLLTADLPVAQVPVPGALGLLMLGLFGLGGLARTRRT